MAQVVGSLVHFLVAAPARTRPEVPHLSLREWLSQPSGSVFVVLLLALVVGGGLQALRTLRARRVVERIAVDDPEISAIEEAASCGRAGLVHLFRLLEHPSNPLIRNAAGHALARLWKADELVTEEEMAILVRGRAVNWRARRKYPRELKGPIPMTVEFGVPFLNGSLDSIQPENLKWSSRISGTGKVATEQFSAWRSSPTEVSIELDPEQYTTTGTHRLVLSLKVRTEGMTTNWEREFPQSPFSFEFDPNLKLESLLTSPDEQREADLNDSLRLKVEPADPDHRTFRPITRGHALGNRIMLISERVLPCDLAHQVHLEIEGQAIKIPAGTLVAPISQTPFPPLELIPVFTSENDELCEMGMQVRIRAVMRADPSLAWSDPQIRSVWPGTIVTSWQDIDVFRT